MILEKSGCGILEAKTTAKAMEQRKNQNTSGRPEAFSFRISSFAFWLFGSF